MGPWLRRATFALALLLTACGGSFVIIVNSGVIVGAPHCEGSGGQFDLLDSGGLRVLVVITSSTRIVVRGGGTGSCTDLVARAPVEVAGRQSGERLIASTVRLR